MEGKSFLSSTEKKSGARDPIPVFGSPARSPPLSPLWVAPAHVKFRILCPESRAGAVIGYCGSVINQIKQLTRSKIRVEDAPLGSPDRVVTVVAHGDSGSRVKLDDGYGEEEEVEVSRAQEALIRVFEALIEGFGTGTVSCRLLMEASHVGAVKGAGGEIVEMIMKETRCKVQIGTDHLPICADPDDALVEGDDHKDVDPRDSLHRHFEIGQRDALDRRLEPFPPDDYQRRTETTTQETLSQPRIDTHPHRIIASASKKDPVTIEQPLSEPDDDIRKIVFKLLCPTESAGGLIGPGGANIKTIQSESGASIYVADTPANCDECLITITSEIPEDRLSPAQRAIVLISGEFPTVKGVIYRITSVLRALGIARRNTSSMGFHPSSSDSFTISTRRGIRSKDSFQRVSHNPANYSKPVDVNPYIRPQDPFLSSFSPTSGYPPNFGQGSTTDVDHLLSEAPSQLWSSPPPAAPRGAYDVSGGLSSTMADLGLVSGHISSVVTNITVETRVPENAVSFVCGGEVDGHYRLNAMRRISGATVIVHEPQLGTSYRIIAISGTPDQIQTALKILHALLPLSA
ncbi:unnamed protein product [Thlaspi arvense]|uniref:K Homology domain-containing protein n=1 Tax=Thlaspi arvense TaxID=13288 RepID=A0AAU9SXX2_THLAR|nr:unnamed protein product [Thlaspi arvense]